MKKSTTTITIIFICIIVAIVGAYAYVANRNHESAAEVSMSPVQTALARNLSLTYPSTPKEVLKYYNELLKCLYNEGCSSDEIDALGLKARELYDDELLEANELGAYLINLHQDVKTYTDNKRRISSAALPSSTEVEYFEADGFSFAKLTCLYTIREGSSAYPLNMVYLLRRDDSKHWKIYGWEDSELLKEKNIY